MNFKKVFRGYDPDQVDKYIAETALKEQQLRVAQKERIDELLDENYTLRQQVAQYQTDEQAISKSLVASQKLAQELKFDAEKYSDLVLSRAKIFYATWRAYAQTLIASLSPEEVEEFNKIQKKIENIINAYEGKDIEKEISEREQQVSKATATAPKVVEDSTVQPKQKQPQPTAEAEQSLGDQPKASTDVTVEEASTEQPTEPHSRVDVDVTPSETTMGIYSNPIRKIEQAADQVIDLRELTKVDMSLEDLCAELGLTVRKDNK